MTYADNRALEFFKKNGFQILNKAGAYKFKGQIEMYYEASLMKFTFGETTEASTQNFQSEKPSAITEAKISPEKQKIESPRAEMKNDKF